MYIYLLRNGAGTQQMFEMTNNIYSNPHYCRALHWKDNKQRLLNRKIVFMIVSFLNYYI